MSARVLAAFSILIIAGRLEAIAAAAGNQPDPIRVTWADGHQSEVTEKELKRHAVFSVRPDYPIEARRARLEGAGFYVMNIDKKTGAVTKVDIETSAGNKVLDGYATTAFSKWRFKPGVLVRVRMPSAFIIWRPANPWVY
jgi:TonB family protein